MKQGIVKRKKIIRKQPHIRDEIRSVTTEGLSEIPEFDSSYLQRPGAKGGKISIAKINILEQNEFSALYTKAMKKAVNGFLPRS